MEKAQSCVISIEKSIISKHCKAQRGLVSPIKKHDKPWQMYTTTMVKAWGN